MAEVPEDSRGNPQAVTLGALDDVRLPERAVPQRFGAARTVAIRRQRSECGRADAHTTAATVARLGGDPYEALWAQRGLAAIDLGNGRGAVRAGVVVGSDGPRTARAQERAGGERTLDRYDQDLVALTVDAIVDGEVRYVILTSALRTGQEVHRWADRARRATIRASSARLRGLESSPDSPRLRALRAAPTRDPAVSSAAENPSPLTREDLAPWIDVRFDRSGGPGGQNVNKVATRATVLFDFEACPLLTAADRARLREKLATRRTKDGRLRAVSSRHRHQGRNRAAATERLLDLVLAALTRPKRRRATRPTRGSKQRRLDHKRRRGETKARRRRPRDDGS